MTFPDRSGYDRGHHLESPTWKGQVDIMGGRSHECEVCGRGGLNDPKGECVCPSPSLPAEPSTEALNAAYAAYTDLGEDNFDAVRAALRAAYRIDSNA